MNHARVAPTRRNFLMVCVQYPSVKNMRIIISGKVSHLNLLSVKLTAHMLGKPWGCYIISSARLLASSRYVSMHPEGPATGHLDTGFLHFPVSGCSFQVPSLNCMLPMKPSTFTLIKNMPFLWRPLNYFSFFLSFFFCFQPMCRVRSEAPNWGPRLW
jgi:hypothetical protein